MAIFPWSIWWILSEEGCEHAQEGLKLNVGCNRWAAIKFILLPNPTGRISNVLLFRCQYTGRSAHSQYKPFHLQLFSDFFFNFFTRFFVLIADHRSWSKNSSRLYGKFAGSDNSKPLPDKPLAVFNPYASDKRKLFLTYNQSSHMYFHHLPKHPPYRSFLPNKPFLHPKSDFIEDMVVQFQIEFHFKSLNPPLCICSVNVHTDVSNSFIRLIKYRYR